MTLSRRSRSAALALLCAADLLVMLDGMVVTVALPAIEHDLRPARGDLQWVVTAYTLSLGAFMLVGGRAGDLYGRRRTLVAGLALFAVASAVVGLAGDGPSSRRSTCSRRSVSRPCRPGSRSYRWPSQPRPGDCSPRIAGRAGPRRTRPRA